MTDTQTSGFEAAFQEVQALAATFQAGEAHYLSPGYQEQEARQDFIDKFWTALGWDVGHNTQTNPYAQEVKVERSVSMHEGKKRADYAFYLDPDYKKPQFFVEAKKPSVDIANKDSYFQAIRYGWNAETPLAVLTDFEQFHVLDSRGKPAIDTALSHAVQKYHYSDYRDRDKFGAIYWLFSREAVAAGALETYAKQMPKASGKTLQRGLFHGGYQGIDESFLRELDEYRGRLARAFHAANPALDSETLTEATQRVLDRLVFIRFLEDKGIEPEPMVAHFGDKGHAWAGFLSVSRRLDAVYNGNIFKPHFIDKPGFHAPDSVFGQICSDLSSEQSPYLFSLIPIHILGSIYERFLGKIIVVDGGAARVEEKPEVRKAGGVYYTPDYIVRYIVDHTVGRQIAGKTPAEIAALRFADIACGSGSFLLGVYDCLLRYHAAYYNAKTKGRTQEAKKAGCEPRDGVWHLSLWQKRQILLNNVWGVDIDAQAVEVAQMSLYLKLLEEETTATAHEQNLLHGTILPTLNKNIVFGNSLIGTDILEGQLFEPTEERKLNPLDFPSAFPQIMKNGGFDAIVGNPPWGADFVPAAYAYMERCYQVPEGGSTDSYALFVERAMTCLRKQGLLGYITPDTFLRKDNYLGTRKYLLNNWSIKELIETGPVFSQVRDTWCLVMTVAKEKPGAKAKIRHRQISRFVVSAEERLSKFEQGDWDKETEVHQEVWQKQVKMIFGYLVSESEQGIIAKIEKHPTLAHRTDEFRVSRGEEGSKFALQKSEDGNFTILIPADVKRYFVANGLRASEKHLTKTKVSALYKHPKIWITRIQKMRWKQRLVCGFDARTNSAGMKTLQVIVSSVSEEKPLLFLMAVISSSLMNFYCVNYLADDMNQSYLERLPIRRVDFSNPADKAGHDKMVNRVEQMLAAKKERANALTDRDTDYWQRRCDTLDRQIDELVYELYGLTDDEIALVEGADAAGKTNA